MTGEPLDPEVEARWRENLTQGHRSTRVGRALFRHLPTEPRCKVCSNPFGGVGGKVVGWLGFRPSRKNPNLCTLCCDKMPQGGAEVDVAVLFADVRGSTALGEQMHPAEYAGLMNRFYGVATRALLRHDAIIDKLIGDEVMALFVPGFCGPEYRRRSLEAAVDLLAAVRGLSSGEHSLEVGIGVHAGVAFVGNVGADALVDFTALGDAVNTAARLRTEAGPGQLLITDSIYGEVRDRLPDLPERSLTLRGRDEPLTVRVLSVA